MNSIRLVYFMLFMGICVSGGFGYSQDFPTDKGSIVLSGSFSEKSSNDAPFAYYESRTELAGSLTYMLIPDLSLGIYTDYEKITSGTSFRMDRMLGPQLVWYVGGHQHKPKMSGQFLQYLGVGVLHRKWVTNQLKCDSTGCRYEKSAYSSGVYRFLFGLIVMASNNLGIYGEASVHLFNRRPSIGCVMVDKPGGESSLNLGLIAFIY